jgi:hypothetical protein
MLFDDCRDLFAVTPQRDDTGHRPLGSMPLHANPPDKPALVRVGQQEETLLGLPFDGASGRYTGIAPPAECCELTVLIVGEPFSRMSGIPRLN